VPFPVPSTNSHHEPVSGQACNPPEPHLPVFFLFVVEELTVPETRVAPSLIMWGVVFHCRNSKCSFACVLQHPMDAKTDNMGPIWNKSFSVGIRWLGGRGP